MSVDLRFEGAQGGRLYRAATQLLNEPAFNGRFTLCKNTQTIHCPDESARRLLEVEARSTLVTQRSKQPRRKTSKFSRT